MLKKIFGADDAPVEISVPVVPPMLYQCPNCAGQLFDGPLERGRIIVQPTDGSIINATDHVARPEPPEIIYRCEQCGQTMGLDLLKAVPYTPPRK